MDTELLRTFVEVAKTRHFARAGDNLFVTQAAVSARIRQLEDLVGQRLFTRARNNIQLTPAGRQLLPYAESVLTTWSRALMDTAFKNAAQPLIAAGVLPTLREIFLDRWLVGLLDAAPSWLLQFYSHNSAELVSRVREGALDIGIVYEPPRAADLWAEPLLSFELLLVSTLRHATVSQRLDGYIYVDWGTSLSITHDAELASVAVPCLQVDSPLLARNLILARGGAAYLAQPMISSELSRRRLHVVDGAPAVERTVYLIAGREARDADWFLDFAEALRGIVAAQSASVSA